MRNENVKGTIALWSIVAVGLLFACCITDSQARAQQLDIFTAAQNDDLNRVEALLAGGVNVNAANHAGATALMIASQHGHLDVVRTLLDKGASVNACDPDGESALAIASQHGQSDVVKLLIARGATVDS